MHAPPADQNEDQNQADWPGEPLEQCRALSRPGRRRAVPIVHSMISRIQAALKLSKAHAVIAGTGPPWRHAPAPEPEPDSGPAAAQGHPLRPMLTDLHRLGWVTRLDLPQTNRREARELLASLLGGEPEPGLARRAARGAIPRATNE